MRLTITLKPLTSEPQLMWNYHYPLAAWLYGILAQADGQYATFLHEQGYQIKEGKTFKHFTFSDLKAQITYEKGSSGFKIVSPTVQWTVSFYIDIIAKTFLTGLFSSRNIRIFNREYDTTFTIEKWEMHPPFEHKNTTIFRATSAMVVAEKKDGGDKYLDPTDPQFGHLLITGLIDKYLSAVKEKGDPVDMKIIQQEIRFRLLDQSKMRSRKITIKEHKESETEIKGYRNFTFSLTGPKQVIEVGYLGGLGRYCSEGFGFCEIISTKEANSV